MTCYECGCEIPEGEGITFEEHTFCESCAEDLLTVCDMCGTAILADDSHFVESCEMTACDECFDDRFIICRDCDETYLRSDAHETVDGYYVCHDCANENYYECYNCGQLVHCDDVRWDNTDTPYCERCFPEPQVIHQYNYKPEPKFKGAEGDLFLGVELEIDGGGEDDENAEELLDILNADDDCVYAKHDGSLHDGGIEFVTHPMSLSNFESLPWADFSAEAVRMGYRSHDTSTCGLHVHVGRKQLATDEFSENDIIKRLLWFMQDSMDRLTIFSRRKHSSLNEWAAPYPFCKTADNLFETACSSNRYHALNLQNYSTVEFRLFRGTLKVETLYATVELVEAVIKFVKTDYPISNLTWDEFIRFIPEEKYPHLMNYLKKRGIDKNDESEEI